MNWNYRNIHYLRKVQGIYIFKNKIDGKVYIGQSVDIAARYSTHKTRKEKTIFSKTLHCNGIDKFRFGVLEVVKNTKYLNKREEYWIEFFKSYKRSNGYNHGKYSHAHRRRSFSKEHRKNISKALQGVLRNKNSYLKGLETKIKLNCKNKPFKIEQIDTYSLEVLNTYYSINQASKSTGTPRRSISYAINTFDDRKFKDRVLPKAGKFYWRLIK